MEHNILTMDADTSVQELVIHHRDFNLDKTDNLDTLPDMPAVYALCGRVNGQPANPRFVGCTNNLRSAIRAHYTTGETDECLRKFMQSIKTKTLVFEVMPDGAHEKLKERQESWRERYKPQCNDELNQVY
jgi:hypothetical protein